MGGLLHEALEAAAHVDDAAQSAGVRAPVCHGGVLELHAHEHEDACDGEVVAARLVFADIVA